eukprot:353598_1
MSVLSLNDLDRLIIPCSKYYSLSETETAINTLKNWYVKEAFDEDDITNDWVNGDFKNSHGIDIFVDGLNQAVDNPNSKPILFDWCCHWLLQNIPIPKTRLTNATKKIHIPKKLCIIENVMNKFAVKLSEEIPELTQKMSLGIAQSLKTICNNDDYTELTELNNDFENIEDSFIMDELINNTYPQYQNHRQQMFDILRYIVDNYYAPFDIKLFTFKISETSWNEGWNECKRSIGSLFRNKIGFDKIHTVDETDDLALCKTKTLDFENRFPILMSLVDLYARYRADTNMIFWEKNSFTPKNRHSDSYCTLTISQWLQKSAFYGCLRKQNHYMYNSIKHALDSIYKRVLPPFNFNHQIGHTIFDSFDIFTKYLCAMNNFVHKFIYDQNLPIQIDFWIIPRLTKAYVNQTLIPQDINDVKTPFIDEDDTKNLDSLFGKTQELGLNTSTDGTKIWDLQNNLHAAGYVQGENYWRAEIKRGDMCSVEILVKNMHKLWDNIDLVDMRYKRYILIIDRRNPNHIKNKKMIDDTHKNQTWNDKMYLILPKHKNEICKLYADVMNEVFICNTRDYLLSLPLSANKYFGGLESGNGYKFVVSYHCYFSDKVKMYLYFGGGSMRFFMTDCSWLLPRYFISRDNSFQVLNVSTKIELNNAINKYGLKDNQFEQFAKQMKQLDLPKGKQQDDRIYLKKVLVVLLCIGEYDTRKRVREEENINNLKNTPINKSKMIELFSDKMKYNIITNKYARVTSQEYEDLVAQAQTEFRHGDFQGVIFGCTAHGGKNSLLFSDCCEYGFDYKDRDISMVLSSFSADIIERQSDAYKIFLMDICRGKRNSKLFKPIDAAQIKGKYTGKQHADSNRIVLYPNTENYQSYDIPNEGGVLLSNIHDVMMDSKNDGKSFGEIYDLIKDKTDNIPMQVLNSDKKIVECASIIQISSTLKLTEIMKLYLVENTENNKKKWIEKNKEIIEKKRNILYL